MHQYYEIEQETDLWSFNTGRVQAKMGVNKKEMPANTPISFVLLDNQHLTEHGVRYFCALSKQAVAITSNKSHPAFDVDEGNLRIIFQKKPSLSEALSRLKKECGADRFGICEVEYENRVMQEYSLAAVRRSILYLCFLHVSSNIRGLLTL